MRRVSAVATPGNAADDVDIVLLRFDCFWRNNEKQNWQIEEVRECRHRLASRTLKFWSYPANIKG
jgi:hypothetical protein